MLLPYLQDSLPDVLNVAAIVMGALAAVLVLFGLFSDGEGLLTGLFLGFVAINFHQVAVNDPALGLEGDVTVRYIIPALLALLTTSKEFAPFPLRGVAYLGCLAIAPLPLMTAAVVGAIVVDATSMWFGEPDSGWASPLYGAALSGYFAWEAFPDCSGDVCVGGDQQLAILNIVAVLVLLYAGSRRSHQLRYGS